MPREYLEKAKTIEQLTNTTNPMVSIRREHRALAILRALQSEHGYRINDRVLMQYLDQLALGGTRSDIRASLEFLEQAGLVKSEQVEDVVVIELTEVGEDVALGKILVEGILRPGPDGSY